MTSIENTAPGVAIATGSTMIALSPTAPPWPLSQTAVSGVVSGIAESMAKSFGMNAWSCWLALRARRQSLLRVCRYTSPKGQSSNVREVRRDAAADARGHRSHHRPDAGLDVLHNDGVADSKAARRRAIQRDRVRVRRSEEILAGRCVINPQEDRTLEDVRGRSRVDDVLVARVHNADGEVVACTAAGRRRLSGSD